MWSKLKKLARKIVRVVKALVRAAIRVALLVITFPFKIWDLVFGFLGWPRKGIKLHIAVLQGPDGPLITTADLNDLLPSIELLKRAYKDHCNVTVSPYSSGNKREIDNWAQLLDDQPPPAALDVPGCSFFGSLWENETGDSGEYFRRHTAGWVGGLPISLAFPITVYIVKSIGGTPGYFGCTVPFLTDYLVVGVDALKVEPSTIGHEMGHRCNILPHSDDPSNLMFDGRSQTLPPYRLKGWQRNLLRSSRHVTYMF